MTTSRWSPTRPRFLLALLAVVLVGTAATSGGTSPRGTALASGAPSATPSSTPSSTPAPASALASPAPSPTPDEPAPRDVERAFTLAVVPDTQKEVLDPADTRLGQRMRWLASRRSRTDLRFVVQVGDLTYWGWRDPGQLRRARAAFRPLERAGVPYAVTIGNHDTRLTGTRADNVAYGTFDRTPQCPVELGRAACRPDLLLRDTREIDATFDADDFGAVRGVHRRGSLANTWSAFDVAGAPWLVLTLEPWPRPAAVAWARRVVAAHPDHQVVVSTHHYLGARGGLPVTAPREGVISPRQLFDRLVSVFPNIRLVLSGHVGEAAVRIDRGRHGNRIVSFLQAFHDPDRNPVRMVRVDPVHELVSSRVVVASTGRTLPGTRTRTWVPGLR